MNNINLQEMNEPVTNLIHKLSSGGDIQVTLNSEMDTVLLKTPKNKISQSLHVNLQETNNNFPKIKNFFNLLSNRRTPGFPTYNQKFLIEKLKSVPVYAVVNGNNELVIASPRGKQAYNSLHWVIEKYKELFLWSNDKGPVSVSLFFFNKEDAETYLHEVCKKEPKESEILGLKVSKIGLDVFYKLNRTSPPKIQIKLVADLGEIDKVITQYVNKASYDIHPKQRYSKNWFQGTPIYLLRLTTSSKKNFLISYRFKNNSEKTIIFFSKKDAIRAWKMYSSHLKKDELHNEPRLEIYNLESLLNDLEVTELHGLLDNYLVAPYEAYKEIRGSNGVKENASYTLLETYWFKAKIQYSHLKRFYKGLLWLLTSDTLPSEENSW
uniref:Uncharacterized protein n=1 Tax=Cryptomonas sp. SAG 977-2f TaxID=279061 RepID=A0A679CAR6_9CRYP|nr:hypothetical protein CrySAG9772f_p110 [Cryptomonas sp. SAG 977-2f]